MKELYLKKEYDPISEFKLSTKYDVLNVYTEQQLSTMIHYKVSRTVLKLLSQWYITDQQLNSKQSNITCSYVYQTLYNLYYQIINKCYDNDIIVNFISLPAGLQMDISNYRKSGIQSKCIIAKTRKLKDDETIDQFITMLKQHDIKQLFLYQLVMAKYEDGYGFDSKQNSQIQWQYFIRSYISQLQYPFTIQKTDVIKLVQQRQLQLIRLIERYRVGTQELKHTNTYYKLIDYKNTLQYAKDKVIITQALIDDLQTYNAIDAQKELTRIMDEMELDMFVRANNIQMKHTELYKYLEMNDVCKAKQQILKQYKQQEN